MISEMFVYKRQKRSKFSALRCKGPDLIAEHLNSPGWVQSRVKEPSILMPLAITITIRVPTDNGNEKGAGTVQMKEDKRCLHLLHLWTFHCEESEKWCT